MKFKNPISFLILSLLISVTCFSQSIVNRANSSYTVQDARLAAQYNLLTPRFADSTAANLQKGIDSCGAVVYLYSTHTFWYRSCASSTKKWIELGSNVYTASQGLTLSGNDFQIGGTMDTIRTITFNDGRSSLQFGQVPDWTYYLGEGALNLLTIDTMPNPDTERAWGLNSHTVFRSPNYTSSIYRLGNNLQVTYENEDSVKLNSFGGDFGGAVRANFHFKRLSGYTGRSAYIIGAQTMTDHIPIDISNLDWGDETDVAGTNYKYVKGYIAGKSSYLIMRAADTLTNWMGFNNWGFLPGGYVTWAADYVGGYLGNASTARVGKHWYLYNHGALSPSWLKSAMYIGDSTLDASTLLNVSSTTKGVVFPRMTGAQQNAISSPLAGLMIYNTDSSAYCFYNGSAWTKMGTGSGGGGMTNPMTTEGDLIVGGASGTPTRLAAGTANYILTSNGTGSAPSWLPNAGGTTSPAITVLTSGTTWTTPSDISTATTFKVTLVGGGGGGAGHSAANEKSGAGGAGGALIKYISGLTASTGYTYAIGAAGAGGTGAANGTAGGNTTLTIGATTYTGNGGGFGTFDNLGGTGGTATNGDINIQGQNGGGAPSNASSAVSGTMGGSPGFGLGLGGASIITGNGAAATGYGGGGGGGVGSSNGGAGTQGVIIIERIN